MARVPLGVLLGVVIGLVDVALMLPLSFPDKRAALLGAFFARFALGFFAATVRLPLPPVFSGVLVGILTSVPDAIITKAYAPRLRIMHDEFSKRARDIPLTTMSVWSSISVRRCRACASYRQFHHESACSGQPLTPARLGATSNRICLCPTVEGC
jgi:hypothetical protein